MKKETVLLQELKENGKPRNIPPVEHPKEFWDKLQKSVVGKKRYKVVKKKPETPEIDKLNK